MAAGANKYGMELTNRGSAGANKCGLGLKKYGLGLTTRIAPRLGLANRGWVYTNEYGLLAF